MSAAEGGAAATQSRKLEEQAELIERLRRSLTAVVEDNNDLRVRKEQKTLFAAATQRAWFAGVQCNPEEVPGTAP